ncbi:minor fimbrial subunit HifD [Cupriavidus basilensis OR16]|uniref:Minor fimbrial subunit HifD n=1 Tax=Cupriavidus basilensis OR16 TaxID=1127483 RepID=H1S6V9_9BURK|nr:fimbrial protein [Cupriavidus basilensis]EHP41770.1 minor fimbrial subunit HifD [Cupriavidus basilensis OR16]
MKTKILAIALATAGLMTAAGSAQAADGQIDFTGSVIASTCKINGGTNNLAVPMPSVSTSALSKAGATGGRTPFVLNLTGCAVTKDAPTKVSVSFENGPSVNVDTGRLKLQGTDAAENVEIALLNDAFAPIKVGAATGTQNSQVVTIDGTSGTAKMSYAAEYIATGVATAGKANSFVQYTMVYP